MAKNPNSRPKPVKRDEPMTGAMKFFLGGLAAELYLLIIRRFYLNGTAVQMIAWYDYLLYFAIAGLVVLAVGAVCTAMWWKQPKKRTIGLGILAAGAFLAGASWLIRVQNAAALTLLCILVPMVILLGILWNLYDRECALALTTLGCSLVVLWICRRGLSSMYLGNVVKIAAVLYLVILGALALLTGKASRKGGLLGKLRLLPADTDTLPVYLACGLSAVAVAAALISSAAAYYAMWSLALVAFALAVYYTVKQL